MVAIVLLLCGFTLEDWHTYAPEGKNYRVEMPKPPNSTSSRSVSGPSGKSQLTSAQLKQGNSLYSIQVSEVGGKVDPRTLDNAIRSFAADNNGTLGPLKSITVDGQPGREFTLTEPTDQGEVRSKMRWVASGNKLIMLMSAGAPGTDPPADADRFLTSLKIGATATVAKADAAKSGETKAAASPKSKAGTSKKKSETAKVTISRLPKNAKAYEDDQLEDLKQSFLGRDKEGFRDIGVEGSVLVGVRVTYIERFGGPKVRSAQPIYRSGTKYYEGRVYGEVVGPVTTVVAKPGYAVGGLVTHTGLTVDGFRMVFMKVDGDRLDPDDSYNSPWIGDENGGSPGEVNSKGNLVVGLQGRSGKEVFALGLTTLK